MSTLKAEKSKKQKLPETYLGVICLLFIPPCYASIQEEIAFLSKVAEDPAICSNGYSHVVLHLIFSSACLLIFIWGVFKTILNFDFKKLKTLSNA